MRLELVRFGRLASNSRLYLMASYGKSETASRADGDYVNTVVMPGTILDTNAGEVKGSSVVWRFSDDYLGMADYEMRVESRSVNVWPLAGTGIVVLLLIVFPVATTALAGAAARHEDHA